MLPEGRIAVSALAAPRSSGLWPELCDEIEESLRGGGARVRTAHGDWGRELHARTENAASVFIGADGPRWMVYGVATAAMDTVEALDVELRRVMRGIIVVRGKLPYPPRTVLPLERAEDRAEAENVDKPRGASITVSVPAARPDGARGGRSGRRPARPPPPTAAPALFPPPARPRTVRPSNGATRGRPGRRTRGRCGPQRRTRAAPQRCRTPGRTARRRQAPGRGPPLPFPPGPRARHRRPSRRPDVPDGPGPSERPAANGARRPAPARPAEPVTPPDQSRGPVGPSRLGAQRRPARRRGPAWAGGRGPAPAPRPRRRPACCGPAAPSHPGRRPPPATSSAPAPSGPAAASGPGAHPPSAEDTAAPGTPGGAVPATVRGRPEDTGARRSRHSGAAGGTRARRDAGAQQAPATRCRRPTHPDCYRRSRPPAAGYAEETPVTGTASVRRDDLLWTPETRTPATTSPRRARPPAGPDRGTARTPGPGRHVAAVVRDGRRNRPVRTAAGSRRGLRRRPGGRPGPRPGRRRCRGPRRLDPAVRDPRLRVRRRPGRPRRRRDHPARRQPVGEPARSLGDGRAGRTGTPRAAAGRDPRPRQRPASRMAIEDIPLSDVPLVEATLDAPAVSRRAEGSEGPERSERPEQPELPRRRPSAAPSP